MTSLNKITQPNAYSLRSPLTTHTLFRDPWAWRVLEPHQQEVCVGRELNSRLSVFCVVKMVPDMTNEREIIENTGHFCIWALKILISTSTPEPNQVLGFKWFRFGLSSFDCLKSQGWSGEGSCSDLKAAGRQTSQVDTFRGRRSGVSFTLPCKPSPDHEERWNNVGGLGPKRASVAHRLPGRRERRQDEWHVTSPRKSTDTRQLDCIAYLWSLEWGRKVRGSGRSTKVFPRLVFVQEDDGKLLQVLKQPSGWQVLTWNHEIFCLLFGMSPLRREGKVV